MKPVISIRNLLVEQGDDFSLVIDSLELHPDRIYALTGPNGAGKSTLLRTMALLTSPQRGTIQIAGVGSSDFDRQRRKVTLVEQSPYLLEGSVYDNLAFGLRLRGVRGKDKKVRIKEALEMVGLGGFERRKTRTLSGGEIQRVALARAMVLKPKLLLLDEPTANIDSKSLQSFELLISKLPSYGVTVVFATHDLTQPERLGGEVLRIENGRMLGELE